MVKLCVSCDDITRIPCGAVVNAANDRLAPGGGTDGALRRAGGPSITAATAVAFKKYQEKTGNSAIRSGDVIITKSGDIDEEMVIIHTVPPILRGISIRSVDGQDAIQDLLQAYYAPLQWAEDSGIEHIVFPLLATGNFAGNDSSEVTRLAFVSILSWLRKLRPSNVRQIEIVHLNQRVVDDLAAMIGGVSVDIDSLEDVERVRAVLDRPLLDYDHDYLHSWLSIDYTNFVLPRSDQQSGNAESAQATGFPKEDRVQLRSMETVTQRCASPNFEDGPINIRNRTSSPTLSPSPSICTAADSECPLSNAPLLSCFHGDLFSTSADMIVIEVDENMRCRPDLQLPEDVRSAIDSASRDKGPYETGSLILLKNSQHLGRKAIYLIVRVDGETFLDYVAMDRYQGLLDRAVKKGCKSVALYLFPLLTQRRTIAYGSRCLRNIHQNITNGVEFVVCSNSANYEDLLCAALSFRPFISSNSYSVHKEAIFTISVSYEMIVVFLSDKLRIINGSGKEIRGAPDSIKTFLHYYRLSNKGRSYELLHSMTSALNIKGEMKRVVFIVIRTASYQNETAAKGAYSCAMEIAHREGCKSILMECIPTNPKSASSSVCVFRESLQENSDIQPEEFLVVSRDKEVVEELEQLRKKDHQRESNRESARKRRANTKTRSVEKEKDRTSTAKKRAARNEDEVEAERATSRAGMAKRRLFDTEDDLQERRDVERIRQEVRRADETQMEDEMERQRERREMESNERAERRRQENRERMMRTRHADGRPLCSNRNLIIPDNDKFLRNGLPPVHSLGPRTKCDYCGAYNYMRKCCSEGQVHHPPSAPLPQPLKSLLTSQSTKAKRFRQNSLAYNRSFAMSSISHNRVTVGKGAPFVKVNGVLKYNIGSVLPPERRNPVTKRMEEMDPAFSQLYLYDPEEALKYRMQNVYNGALLDRSVAKKLQRMFMENNFLCKQFETLGELLKECTAKGEQVRNLVMILKAPTEKDVEKAGAHVGTMKRAREDIASFLYKETEDGSVNEYGIYVVLKNRKNRPTLLGYFNPLVDPCSYPLIFPYGEKGFEHGTHRLFPKRTVNPYANEPIPAPPTVPPPHNPSPVSSVSFLSSSEESDPENDREVIEPPGEGAIDHMEDSDDNDTEQSVAGDAVSEEGESADDLEPVVSDNERRESNEAGTVDGVEDPFVFLADGTRTNIRTVSQEEMLMEVQAEQIRRLNALTEEISSLDKEIWVQEMLARRLEEGDQPMDIDVEEVDPTEEEMEQAIGAFEETTETATEGRRDSAGRRSNSAEPMEAIESSAVEDVHNGDTVMEEEIVEDSEEEYQAADDEELRWDGMNEFEEPDGELLASGEGFDGETDKWKRKSGKAMYESRRQHTLYFIQERDDEDGRIFNRVLATLTLGQLWIIDQALRIVRGRNNFLRQHYTEMRVADATSLRNYVEEETERRSANSFRFRNIQKKAEKVGRNLGYAFTLPATAPQSVAWYKAEFEKAMHVIHKLGKPDLFITFTGNHLWDEIKDNIPEGRTWQDSPLLVNEVFEKKRKELVSDIVNGQLFGPVACYCFSIEFQKRGMPHMHMLVTLCDGYKLDTPEKIDKYVWARIPKAPEGSTEEEKAMFLKLREYVSQFMVHSPCYHDLDAYCQQRHKTSQQGKYYPRCTKDFPRECNEFTSIREDGKALYHRPADGPTVTKKDSKGKIVDVGSEWVVPYNPYLLAKYKCHLNVEVVSRVHIVKYIFKYIYKGYDRAVVQFLEAFDSDETSHVNNAAVRGKALTPAVIDGGISASDIEEITRRAKIEMKKRRITDKDAVAYDEAIVTEVLRQMTAFEAAWIIMAIPFSGNSHSVKMVSVHEEDKYPVFFRDGAEEEAAERMADLDSPSAFTAYLKLVVNDPNARALTYEELPLHYKLVKNPLRWVQYVHRPTRQVSLVRPVPVKNMELFAIRELARSTPAGSYEDYRTFNGVVYPTVVDAAQARGLINSEREYFYMMNEALDLKYPKQLRYLFATILSHGKPSDSLGLWDAFKEHLVEVRYSIYKEGESEEAKRARLEKGFNHALAHIEWLLKMNDMKLEEVKLPGVDRRLLDSADLEDVHEESETWTRDGHEEQAARYEETMTEEQKSVVEAVMFAVDKPRRDNVFFLQASGGCGKTYVYKSIYHKLTAKGIKVAMVASTGIAATLLIKGTTAHRRFFLPLNITSDTCSKMRVESGVAEQLRQTQVFVFDEATMADKNVYLAIHKLLRDIMQSSNEEDRLFGGKIMLLGGDWKQLLPVVNGKSSATGADMSLLASPIWETTKVLTLSKNIRSVDEEYSRFLEEVGRGLYNGKRLHFFHIPEEKGVMVDSEEKVIEKIYGDGKVEDMNVVAKSCILATRNVETMEINKKVLAKLSGSGKFYYSIDSPVEGIGMQQPPEYFHKEMESGMPPHDLYLKEHCIVILLRNLFVEEGLCNGSRLEVLRMFDHFVVCRLLDDRYKDTNGQLKEVVIPKMKLSPADSNNKKARYTRFQLPLRLAYALTINKSQGQTFEEVGVILSNNVFAHGQAYVALSRCKSFESLTIYSAAEEPGHGNVIYNNVDQRIISILEKSIQASLNGLSLPCLDDLPPIPRPSPLPIESTVPTFSNLPLPDSDFFIPESNEYFCPYLLITNNGSDCFLNSIIQVLRTVADLVESVLERRWMGRYQRLNAVGIRMNDELAPFLNGMGGPMNPASLREAASDDASMRKFRTGQQDVSEFLMSFLDKIGLDGFFAMHELYYRGCDYCDGTWEPGHSTLRVIHICSPDTVIDLGAYFGRVEEHADVHCSCCQDHHDQHNPQTNCDRFYRDCGETDYVPATSHIMVYTNVLAMQAKYNWILKGDVNGLLIRGVWYRTTGFIEHRGDVRSASDTNGHYVAWTKRGTKWMEHNDDQTRMTNNYLPFVSGSSEKEEVEYTPMRGTMIMILTRGDFLDGVMDNNTFYANGLYGMV